MYNLLWRSSNPPPATNLINKLQAPRERCLCYFVRVLSAFSFALASLQRFPSRSRGCRQKAKVRLRLLKPAFALKLPGTVALGLDRYSYSIRSYLLPVAPPASHSVPRIVESKGLHSDMIGNGLINKG